MIEFSSSFKLNEIHIVDSHFNEDPKNFFFQEGPNFWEGTVENLRRMGNNRDIYCYANWGRLISKENITIYPVVPKSLRCLNFLHARPNVRKK